MLETMFSELKAIATSGGASQIKEIDPQGIVVSQWVRNKCQYGCALFGKRFTCPPYVPGIDETKVTIQGYKEALLIEFTGVPGQALNSFKNVTEVAFNMERTAFINGFERAFSYGAGFCTLCPECPAEKLVEPTIFCKKACLQAKKARPSMEAVGIDVFSTVRNFGFELHPVRDPKDTFKLFGLTLLR